MKVTTKFNIKDRVITPISERPGIIWAIRIISETVHKYEIVLEIPYRNESKFRSLVEIFEENELRKP